MRLNEAIQTVPQEQPKRYRLDEVMAMETPEVQKSVNRGFGEKVKFFLGESAKALPRAIETVPAQFEALVQVAEDQIRGIAKKQLAEEGAVFGRSIEGRTPEQTARIAENNKIVMNMDSAIDTSKRLQANWIEAAYTGIEAPDPELFRGSFMENPSFTRAVALGIQSVPMLGLAAAITAATKSPTAGAALLGSLEAAEEHNIQRELGGSEGEALGTFVVNTLALSFLESIPLTGFMKGGALPIRAFRGAIQEGSEEVLQSLWKDSVAKIGYDDTRKLTANLVESFIAGAISGGVIGGFSPVAGIQKSMDKASKKGVEVDKMIEAVSKQVTNEADNLTEIIASDSNLDTTEAIAPVVDPLIEEAKKYKSAEEFVGSKGKPLYHGTNKEFTVFGEKEGTGKGATTLGSWFTSNRKQAEAIAEGQSKNSLIIEGKKTNANVVEAYADVKNTKTIDMKNEQLLPDDANNIVLQAKKDGFDSVVFKNTLVVDGVFADHTVIINPKDIKTKNQLEDVWNKSQAKNSLEQDKKKLEDFINKRADELEGTIFAPKGNRDAALKKVSEEFQKGEVPDEMDELSMQFLKSTKDLETGEIIDITSEDFPRTGTLLNFLNSQQDDIYNKAKVDKVAEKPIALNKEEVNPKSIKAVDGKSKLDAKIEGLKDQKLIGEQAKDALDYVKQLQNDLKNSVRAYKDGKLQEEYEGIPAKYRTTNKNANGMDEVASELGISENELSGYLQDLDNQSDRLKQTIEDNKTRFIKKAEITTLKQKVKDIESGIRQGKKLATDKIKDMQSELIENINAYKMEAKDKAKLLATVKNANTDEKLIKALKSVEERATKFAESSEKHKIIDNIKKELKTTKPIKKGQRTVGRYEYDTNKIFDSIREGNKLTKEQAQAMLDSIPDDANTELDLIKKRLLSLKANGMDSSVELFRQVQKDIKRLKLEGARSKNEVDFMERMEYKEQKQEIVDEMDRVKPEDVINWKTRAFNFYRKGLSNYQSLLNSIAGKETSEKYDLQSAEAEYTTKIQEKTRKISEDSAKILGINDRDYLRLISEASENKYKLYENKENGNIYNMSILDIIDIYNGIKNEHTKERAYDVYGEEQVNDMLNLLSDEQKEMANYWQEVAQSNKNTYNQYLIDTTGRDMGEVENYWMRTSELDIDINNDLIMQSNIPSAAKARSAGNIVPIFKNALSKLMKNVNDAQYIESLNDKYIEAKKMFSDRKVKNMIENKYGADIYQNLMKKIDMLSLQGKQDDADFISSLFNGALNGWVIAKIGLSESVLVKQLISMGNYMENMKAVDWTKGFGEGLKNPKQTFDFMWNNSSYIRERFKRGYNEAVQIALNEANTLKSFRGDVFKFVSFFARAGDITAIIYGGYPLVQQQLAEGKTMEEAMEVFTLATVKAQQSGLVSSRSDFQNSKNGFARIFLAFKNTVNQYTRKMVDATVMYKNGDIDAKQYGKVMSIYGVIQPALFGATSHVVGSNMYKMISSLLKGDDDEDADYLPDLLKTMILSIATNPVNAIPFLRDSVEYGARKLLDMNTYDPFSMGIIDDLRRSWQKMGKDDKNALDYFEMLGGVVEPVIGVPIKRPVRIIKNLAGIRRFDHVSTAHANFVERFGKIKKVRKQVKKAEDKNDQKKVKKIKSDNKEILNKYDTMNSYYKEIASIKKDINNINKKKSLSSNDKERINKLKSKITEKAKKAIQYYDNRR